MNDLWLLRDGEKHGPYSREQIEEFAGRGLVNASDRIWHAGLDGWQGIDSVLPQLESSQANRLPAGTQAPVGDNGAQESSMPQGKLKENSGKTGSFLRTGLTWIPLLSGLLVGALGFQPFLTALAHADIDRIEGGVDKVIATVLTDVGIGQMTREPVILWIPGVLVGAVNGVSFGILLALAATTVSSTRRLWVRFTICSILGGVIGLVLNGMFGGSPLALVIGYLDWPEGLLLGACFAMANTLDQYRVSAVSEASG